MDNPGAAATKEAPAALASMPPGDAGPYEEPSTTDFSAWLGKAPPPVSAPSPAASSLAGGVFNQSSFDLSEYMRNCPDVVEQLANQLDDTSGQAEITTDKAGPASNNELASPATRSGIENVPGDNADYEHDKYRGNSSHTRGPAGSSTSVSRDPSATFELHPVSLLNTTPGSHTSHSNVQQQNVIPEHSPLPDHVTADIRVPDESSRLSITSLHLPPMRPKLATSLRSADELPASHHAGTGISRSDAEATQDRDLVAVRYRREHPTPVGADMDHENDRVTAERDQRMSYLERRSPDRDSRAVKSTNHRALSARKLPTYRRSRSVDVLDDLSITLSSPVRRTAQSPGIARPVGSSPIRHPQKGESTVRYPAADQRRREIQPQDELLNVPVQRTNRLSDRRWLDSGSDDDVEYRRTINSARSVEQEAPRYRLRVSQSRPEMPLSEPSVEIKRESGVNYGKRRERDMSQRPVADEDRLIDEGNISDGRSGLEDEKRDTSRGSNWGWAMDDREGRHDSPPSQRESAVAWSLSPPSSSDMRAPRRTPVTKGLALSAGSPTRSRRSQTLPLSKDSTDIASQSPTSSSEAGTVRSPFRVPENKAKRRRTRQHSDAESSPSDSEQEGQDVGSTSTPRRLRRKRNAFMQGSRGGTSNYLSSSYRLDPAELSLVDLEVMLPDHDESCARRSERTRVPALRHWANEKVKYRVETDAKGRRVGYHVEDIVRPVEVWRPKLNQRSRNSDKARPTPPESIPMYNSETRRVEEVAAVKTIKKAKFVSFTNGNNDFRFATYCQSESARTGLIVIPRYGRKERRSSESSFLHSIVLSGRVEVELHNDVVELQQGDGFVVPNQNVYALRNVGDREARIFVFQENPAAG